MSGAPIPCLSRLSKLTLFLGDHASLDGHRTKMYKKQRFRFEHLQTLQSSCLSRKPQFDCVSQWTVCISVRTIYLEDSVRRARLSFADCLPACAYRLQCHVSRLWRALTFMFLNRFLSSSTPWFRHERVTRSACNEA